MEIAWAVRLDEAKVADPEYVRQMEASLMQTVDDTLRFEKWRQGRELYLKYQGFARDGLVLELRGRIQAEHPGHGAQLRGKDGRLRYWFGPGAERPPEGFTIDALPLVPEELLCPTAST